MNNMAADGTQLIPFCLSEQYTQTIYLIYSTP
jgi:hypothetical protein